MNLQRAVRSTCAICFRIVSATVHGIVVTRLAKVLVGPAADEHGDAAAVFALKVDKLIAMQGTLVFTDPKRLRLARTAQQVLSLRVFL